MSAGYIVVIVDEL